MFKFYAHAQNISFLTCASHIIIYFNFLNHFLSLISRFWHFLCIFAPPTYLSHTRMRKIYPILIWAGLKINNFNFFLFFYH